MSTSQKTILLVDDDDTILELLAITFELKGFNVLKARDGGDARDRLSKVEVDIILIDLLMPVMDGRKFLEWLRKERKTSEPVAVLTSIVGKDAEHTILEAGANVVLRKPIRPDEILKVVSQLLDLEAA